MPSRRPQQRGGGDDRESVALPAGDITLIIETTIRPREIGIRSIPEFDSVRGVAGAGVRLETIRRAAHRFRERFAAAGSILAARTLLANRFPWPKEYAFFRGSLPEPVTHVVLQNRMLVVRFRRQGEEKTLLFNPIVGEHGLAAPGFARLAEKMIEIGAAHPGLLELPRSPLERLAEIGLGAEDIDFVVFDHLHGQDLRPMLGTRSPAPDSSDESFEPMYPNAVWLLQRSEIELFRRMHPIQRPWFVRDALENVRTDQVCVLDGDFELGEGVALLHTPGHTPGNQSLVLATPHGVFTLSENGVAPDAYNPRASRIPGLRETAEREDWECIVNGNAIDNLVEQYTSMVKEKSVAGPSRRDPDFFNTYQSSAMIVSTVAPGIEPAFDEDDLDFGEWPNAALVPAEARA